MSHIITHLSWKSCESLMNMDSWSIFVVEYLANGHDS